MGRAEIVNRLLNGIIVTISTLVFLDWMSIKMNNAMTGLFAFGSAGTLAFSLASKGLVTQLLSGLFLVFSDKMYVGDSVIFGESAKLSAPLCCPRTTSSAEPPVCLNLSQDLFQLRAEGASSV